MYSTCFTFVFEIITLALEEQALIYQSLERWFDTPQGQGVAGAFCSEIEGIIKYLKGSILIQLGQCGSSPWLHNLSFKHKWVVNPYPVGDKITCVASLHELPFERDSIECIIAPLTSEAFSRAKSPLDEMDRILKPMGYMIFLGINPWSFWGFALRWGNLSCFGQASLTPVSSFSLKRALQNRGYQQCLHDSFFYIPPFTNSKIIKQLEFFNEVGKMVRPFPAGFYCLVVQKYQHAQPFLLMDPIEIDSVCKAPWSAAGNTRLTKNV